MQADEFEKKVRSKLEELELVPGSEVWKQVSIRIDIEKNKRRVLLFWIFTGLVLLAGTSVYLLTNNENNNKTAIIEINNNSSKRENYEIKQERKKLPRNLQKVQKIPLEKSVTHFKKADIKRVSASERKTNDLSKIQYAKIINQRPVLTNKKEKAYIFQKEEKYAQKPLPLHKFYNPGAAAKTDTAFSSTSGNEKTALKKDTAAYRTAKKTIDKKPGKNLHVGFTLYTGFSDNLSGLLSTDKSYAQQYYSTPGTSLTPGNSNYDVSVSNSYKSAISFGFGLFVKNQLTKRIGLSAGVDYHLYKAKSMVGSKVNQQTNFFDSLLEKSIVVNNYYTTGSSVKYTNKYQLLELPINILLQLNKNVKKPLLFSAGISPGYLIASNALYANPSANVYYADKEKFHLFQLSAQSSLMIPVSNSNKYSLNAGPVIQYGFTNAAKAVTGSRQHLFFTGIKAAVTF